MTSATIIDTPLKVVVPAADELESALLWPTLDPAALYGLAGEVVQAGSYIDVEPAGLLVAFLTCAATCFGDTGVQVDGVFYPARLYSLLVGSGRGSKAALQHAMKFFLANTHHSRGGARRAERDEPRPCRQSKPFMVDSWPLELGEDFIRATTETPDDDADENSAGPRAVPYRDDRQVLLAVDEFGRTLRAAGHVRNPIASMLTAAWDDAHLKLIGRNRQRIEGCTAHVCLLGQMPFDELRDVNIRSSRAGSLLSRILWVGLRRANASSTRIDDALIKKLSAEVASAVSFAARTPRLSLNPKCQSVWKILKEDFSQPVPGAAGAVAELSDHHVLRLAVVYSLLDCSASILPQHLEAACALWRYCEASARLIFAESRSGITALRILAELRKGPKTQSELLHNVFGKNTPAKDINDALTELQSRGLIVSHRSGGGPGRGRPITTWTLSAGASMNNSMREENA